MTRKLKTKILKTKRGFKMKLKAFFITSKWLPMKHFLEDFMEEPDFKGGEATCLDTVTEMKNVLDWTTCLISMFSELFSPYEHALAALFRKWETSYPRLYSRTSLCCDFGIFKI